MSNSHAVGVYMELFRYVKQYDASLHKQWIAKNGILAVIHARTEGLTSNTLLKNYGGLELYCDESVMLVFFQDSSNISFALFQRQFVQRHTADVYLIFSTLYIAKNELALEYDTNIVFDVKKMPSLYVHTAIIPQFSVQPGVHLDVASMQDKSWQIVLVEQNAVPTPPMQWSFLIRSTLDIRAEKSMEHMWQASVNMFEKVFDNLSMRYVVFDAGYIHVQCNTIEGLLHTIQYYAQYVERVKKYSTKAYMPTYAGVVLNQGINLNATAIDTFLSIDTQQARIHTVHMSLYNALVLSLSYSFLERDYYDAGVAAWVNLDESKKIVGKNFALLSPVILHPFEKHPCFYCGLSTHSSKECPTHRLTQEDASLWQEGLVSYTAKSIADISESIEQECKSTAVFDAVEKWYTENTVQHIALRSIFSVHYPFQVRAIPYCNFHSLRTTSARDVKVEYLYKRLLDGNFHNVEEELTELTRHYKDYRYYSLLGFVALEKGNIFSAIEYWESAERLSYAPSMIAWHVALQARAYEILGKYVTALTLYQKACGIDVANTDVRFRQYVLLLRLGRVDEGISGLQKHITLVPADFMRILFEPVAQSVKDDVERMVFRLWENTHSQILRIEQNIKEDAIELPIWSKEDPVVFTALYDEFIKVFDSKKEDTFLAYAHIIQAYALYRYNFEAAMKKTLEHVGYELEDMQEKLDILRAHAMSLGMQSSFVGFFTKITALLHTIAEARSVSMEQSSHLDRAIDAVRSTKEQLPYLTESVQFMYFIRNTFSFAFLFLKNFIVWECIVVTLLFMGIPALLYYVPSIAAIQIQSPFALFQWSFQKNIILMGTGIVIFVVGFFCMLRFKRAKKAFRASIMKTLGEMRDMYGIST